MKENVIRLKPQFIRLGSGESINVDNIVSLDEHDGKLVFGYGIVMFVTSNDMDAIKENIDVINDGSSHCGQDAENIKDWLEFKRTDSHYIGVDISVDGDHHCCQDAEKPIAEMKNLLGLQVIGIGKGKCEGCPQDNYNTPCVKVELVGGTYLCLAPLPNSIATE